MTQLQSSSSAAVLSLVLLSTKCNTEQFISLFLHPSILPPSILPSTQRLFFICTVPGTVGDAECPWVKNTQHFCQNLRGLGNVIDDEQVLVG